MLHITHAICIFFIKLLCFKNVLQQNKSLSQENDSLYNDQNPDLLMNSQKVFFDIVALLWVGIPFKYGINVRENILFSLPVIPPHYKSSGKPQFSFCGCEGVEFILVRGPLPCLLNNTIVQTLSGKGVGFRIVDLFVYDRFHTIGVSRYWFIPLCCVQTFWVT